MNLQLDESVAYNYKSKAQKIRVMSEHWFVENIFCPCCGNVRVEKLPNNSPVADVHCENCGEVFELKSKQNSIGAKIMQYSATLSVTDLTLVPKFFFTPDIIEKRKPLSANARRAGWVGCNILYDKIPAQGKLPMIRGGKEIDSEEILRRYNSVKKLQTSNISLRGWLMDVLACVNSTRSETFTLQDIYKYADALGTRHNQNRNVEAKIRQQLQFLRDKGFLEFVGRGVKKSRRHFCRRFFYLNSISCRLFSESEVVTDFEALQEKIFVCLAIQFRQGVFRFG